MEELIIQWKKPGQLFWRDTEWPKRENGIGEALARVTFLRSRHEDYQFRLVQRSEEVLSMDNELRAKVEGNE